VGHAHVGDPRDTQPTQQPLHGESSQRGRQRRRRPRNGRRAAAALALAPAAVNVVAAAAAGGCCGGGLLLVGLGVFDGGAAVGTAAGPTREAFGLVKVLNTKRERSEMTDTYRESSGCKVARCTPALVSV
jgi:hypothetical protein